MDIINLGTKWSSLSLSRDWDWGVGINNTKRDGKKDRKLWPTSQKLLAATNIKYTHTVSHKYKYVGHHILYIQYTPRCEMYNSWGHRVPARGYRSGPSLPSRSIRVSLRKRSTNAAWCATNQRGETSCRRRDPTKRQPGRIVSPRQRWRQCIYIFCFCFCFCSWSLRTAL